jgi:outer membrane protein OmpA-like peptidoglycan-associated protein
MNYKKFLPLMALVAIQLISAQTDEKRLAIGANFLDNEYNGDYGNGVWNFKQKGFYGGGLSLSYYLNPSFNIGLQGTTGNYGYIESVGDQFTGAKLDMSLFAQYKLNNGYILKETSKLSPFVELGLGFAKYSINNDAQPWPTIIVDKPDFVVPIGLGLKYQLTKSLAIQYKWLYNFTNSDIHDQNRGYPDYVVFGTPNHPYSKSGNDAYGQHLLGIALSFGKAKDKDKDGVADKLDKCLDTPLNVKVTPTGCPVDSDADGVADYLDKCNDTPAGVQVYENGCPVDTDKDGITDNLDKCPNIAGIAKFNGCPDTDKDGIRDELDECPEIAGNLNGCPDKDNDGIADSKDKCPDVAGVVENNGCPEIKEKSIVTLPKPLKNVHFETAKFNVNKTAISILNQGIKELKNNSNYQLEINGHADSRGDEQANMILSQNRAEAVKAFLVSKGIEESRLITKGFGETAPKADNNTAEGRAENRCVELKLLMQ